MECHRHLSWPCLYITVHFGDLPYQDSIGRVIVFCNSIAYHHMLDMIFWNHCHFLQSITMTSHERHVVSNHRSFDCLFNCLCRPTSKKHQRPHYWPFVRGIHRWPVKGQQRGKSFHLMTSSWVQNLPKMHNHILQMGKVAWRCATNEFE